MNLLDTTSSVLCGMLSCDWWDEGYELDGCYSGGTTTRRVSERVKKRNGKKGPKQRKSNVSE
jgi:hypothetical protein